MYSYSPYVAQGLVHSEHIVHFVELNCTYLTGPGEEEKEDGRIPGENMWAASGV